MIREIKFRAWDGQVMHHNVSIINGEAIRSGYAAHAWMDEAKAGTPMQYTGLHDKNGVEIYEGDVVSDSRYSYKIRWSKEAPAFEAVLIGSSIFNWLSDGMSECEVIGNIYENPERFGGGNTNGV